MSIDITEILIGGFLLFFVLFGYFFKKEMNKLMKEKYQLSIINKTLQNMEKIKTEFITIAAHQFRTPLTKIKWALEFLKTSGAETMSPEQNQILDSLLNSNEKLVELVNDLLDVSRIDDKNLGYNFKKLSLEDIAEKAAETFSVLIKEKEINLKVEVPKEKIPEIFMDPNKISLVFHNLLNNAINYTPKGGGIVINLENMGNCAKVLVKDNGIGVPKEEQEKIFSRFFRAKNAVRVQTEGTGLGLYIVKSIIKVHGGEVGFESEEGKGSMFYFTLPFLTQEQVEKNIEEFVKAI